MAEEAIKASKLNYVIFRFFNLTGADPEGEFGEAHEPETHLIPRLILNMDDIEINGTDYDTKDGTCVRDYVHVNEICYALMLAIEEPANGLENLGHGVGKSVKDMVEIFKIVNQTSFDVKIGPRKQGDPAVSVLQNPGRYMKHLYDFKDLLKVQ